MAKFSCHVQEELIVHKVSELLGSMKCPCQEAKFQYFLEDVNDNNQQLSELLSPDFALNKKYAKLGSYQESQNSSRSRFWLRVKIPGTLGT